MRVKGKSFEHFIGFLLTKFSRQKSLLTRNMSDSDSTYFSESETEDYSSYDDSSYLDDSDFDDLQLGMFPNHEKDQIVPIPPPNSKHSYDFNVIYNDRIPTGQPIEIPPDNKTRRSFVPNLPKTPSQVYSNTKQWGGRNGTYDRHEIWGIDPSRRNGPYNDHGRLDGSEYPFPNQENFNIKDQFLGGIGPLPNFGSHVKQGMGDVSQKKLEVYTGTNGYQPPKKEVENSHPRNRQQPIKFEPLEEQRDRIGASIEDKKPFQLPFQQGRDTGPREMPFGLNDFRPELRPLPTDVLYNTQVLPSIIQNIPSQAQPNPNMSYMQNTQPFPQLREPMFDYSLYPRTPNPVPNDQFKPPLMQAPIRTPVTNRADTEVPYSGVAHNSSLTASYSKENWENMVGNVIPQEMPQLGPLANPNHSSAGGQVFSESWEARQTQREETGQFNQIPRIDLPNGSAVPNHYIDQMRPTIKETTNENVTMPKIQMVNPSAPVLHYNDKARPTLRETTENDVVTGGLGGHVSNKGSTLPYIDKARTTLRETTESNVATGGLGGHVSNKGSTLPYIDKARTTTLETTENNVITGRLGGQVSNKGSTLPYIDKARTTTLETTENNVITGRLGGQVSNKGSTLPYIDKARTTTLETTENNVVTGRLDGHVSNKGSTLPYIDKARTTTLETTENNVSTGILAGEGSNKGPIMPYFDKARTTTLELTETGTMIGGLGNQVSNKGTTLPYIGDLKPTIKQTTENNTVMGGMGNVSSNKGSTLRYNDKARTTTKQTTVENVANPRYDTAQGKQGGHVSSVVEVRPGLKPLTEEGVHALNAQKTGGGISGVPSNVWRNPEENQRDTTAETSSIGTINNPNGGQSGVQSNTYYADETERNLGGMEKTYSFGPISSKNKAPEDRAYLKNITFDDRKEIGNYNRIPNKQRFTDVPRNYNMNFNLKSDNNLNPVRTGNPSMPNQYSQRIWPKQQYSDTKDIPPYLENHFIQPYQTAQLRSNPYRNDVTEIAFGQPQFMQAPPLFNEQQ